MLGQTLSSKFGSSRSNNAQLEGSHASHPQDSVHAPGAEYTESELEVMSARNQLDSNTTEVTVQMVNAEESQSNSWHPSANSQQSTKCQLVANMESLSNTEHPSYLEAANTKNGISSENQHASGMTEQSSPDDVKTTDMLADGFSEQSISPVGYKESINDIIQVEGSLLVEANGSVERAEEYTSGGYDNHDIETGAINNNAELVQNVKIGNNQGEAEQHLKKTRTNLLLLAILAVSLTYQSGMNPPGGFWSGSDGHHSAGDRLLGDTNHSRFIAFFYLNAIAFVTSIVTILILLDKNLTMKITKRRELQIAMIVDLLSLTGAFVMGSCREAEKSIAISVLVCLVLAYVAVHILIAIHVIFPKLKDLVTGRLKQLGHKKTGTVTKELERRCNLLLTVAILAATVTYQAGMNRPGGVWSDDSDLNRTPGNPILQDKHPGRYDVFYYSNSVSFVSSVVITILLVNKESCEYGIKFYALRVCLVVGLLGLLIAYAAGSCRNWKESIFVIIVAVAVIISLVIQILLSSMHNTLGRPLDCFIRFLQKCAFIPETENTGQEITSESSEASDCNEKKKRKRHKYLMLMAILAASSTYQAALSPPGGFWSDDIGHFAGDPVLHDINHRRYKTFFCFNAISFMASIVVIMLLLSKSVRKKDVPLEVLLLIMILDLLALMIAFAAGSCRKFKTSVYVFMLVAGVVIYLVIVIILSRGIEKCLKKVRSGLFCSKHPEHGSRAITPVQGEQI